jgi:Transposase DDE domain/Transposase domain (DUF772)
MVALVLHAFATRQRSSRAIERHCRQDVAYRVITGNLIPDHATIARFVCRHERALADLFGEVLKLCDRAGLVKPGVVSIDGTRLAGNASPEANYGFEQIAREILAEAKATDEAEDELYGDARGDELPEQLRTSDGRREFFRRARQKPQSDRAQCEQPLKEAEPETEISEEAEYEFDTTRIVARIQGREGWWREAKRQLERQRWEDPDEISRSRPERLLLAAERLEGDLDARRRGNEAYEAYREQGRMKDGRRFGGPPNPYVPPEIPEGKVNVTDPDSRPIRSGLGSCRATTRRPRSPSGRSCWRRRSLTARPTSRSLTRWSPPPLTSSSGWGSTTCQRRSPPTPATGTSSTWTRSSPTSTSRSWSRPTRAPALPPSAGCPRGVPHGCGPCWAQSTATSGIENANRRVEPLFGNTKHNSGVYRFHRRGRIKVRLEWRLLMMAHNLTKVHRHQRAAVAT